MQGWDSHLLAVCRVGRSERWRLHGGCGAVWSARELPSALTDATLARMPIRVWRGVAQAGGVGRNSCMCVRVPVRPAGAEGSAAEAGEAGGPVPELPALVEADQRWRAEPVRLAEWTAWFDSQASQLTRCGAQNQGEAMKCRGPRPCFSRTQPSTAQLNTAWMGHVGQTASAPRLPS
jgi:hypothetical protein